MARRSDEEQVEKKEEEFDELQAMRRIDNLLRRAPDDRTRTRITRWLFAKWGEQEDGG